MDQKTLLKLVCGFLRDNGYYLSILAIMDDSGFEFEGDVEVGALRQMLDEYTELKERTKRPTKRFDPSDLLIEAWTEVENWFLSDFIPLFQGDGDFFSEPSGIDNKIHSGNIIAVRITQSGNVISAGVERSLEISKIENKGEDGEIECVKVASYAIHDAPVLSIDVHPSDDDLIASSDMAGKVIVSRISTGVAQFVGKVHRKYVPRVRWSSCGRYLASASYDHTLHLYKMTVSLSSFPVSFIERIHEQKSESGEISFAIERELTFSGAVEAVCFSPPINDSPLMLVGVRDDHLIHCFNLQTGSKTDINMNALGDDFVSFTAMEVSFHPNGKYFLVSTDKGRLILYALDGTQVRNFYGATNDAFSSPRHCWHPSGAYIYSTSQDHSIVVFEVSSQRILETLSGHTAVVRDLHVNSSLGLLVSVGFDKTIRFWV